MKLIFFVLRIKETNKTIKNNLAIYQEVQIEMNKKIKNNLFNKNI